MELIKEGLDAGEAGDKNNGEERGACGEQKSGKPLDRHAAYLLITDERAPALAHFCEPQSMAKGGHWLRAPFLVLSGRHQD